MNGSLLLLLGSLCYVIMISILYFRKKKISSLENKIYKYMLLTTIFGIIMDSIGIYVHIELPDTSLIRWLVLRSYHSFILTMELLFSLYLVSLNSNRNEKKEKKLFNILTILYLISVFFVIILPVEYHKDGNIIFATGPNISYLYFTFGVTMVSWIIYMIKNIKSIINKKHTPIIMFVVLSVPVTLIQMNFPELLLVTALIAFVVVYMYHTIENPDLKMIEELSKSRDIAENSNSEKEIFLFDMSQSLRTPIKDIESMSENALNSDDNEFIRENLRDINTSSKNLSSTINGLLGISASESHNIEIRNSKYNLELMLNSVTKNYGNICKSKNIEFRFNIDKTLPKNLFGDPIRLKHIITIILDNAVKYTEKGYIELTVNGMMKLGTYRLIINIEDSGIGIESERLYQLLNNSKELNETGDNLLTGDEGTIVTAKTLANLIGGTLLGTSELGVGSKFTIIVEQDLVIEQEEYSEKIVDQYEKQFNSKGKILIVEPNEKIKKNIEKIMSKNNIDIEYYNYSVEVLKKMRNNEECNLIILDEELPKLSVYETMKKLSDINDFNTPVVVLTAKNSELNEHYDSYGFNDTLVKPINKNNLENLINKYIK